MFGQFGIFKQILTATAKQTLQSGVPATALGMSSKARTGQSPLDSGDSRAIFPYPATTMAIAEQTSLCFAPDHKAFGGFVTVPTTA
jgi:hypothetical protein